MSSSKSAEKSTPFWVWEERQEERNRNAKVLKYLNNQYQSRLEQKSAQRPLREVDDRGVFHTNPSRYMV
jgi:hypothetical protein